MSFFCPWKLPFKQNICETISSERRLASSRYRFISCLHSQTASSQTPPDSSAAGHHLSQPASASSPGPSHWGMSVGTCRQFHLPKSPQIAQRQRPEPMFPRLGASVALFFRSSIGRRNSRTLIAPAAGGTGLGLVASRRLCSSG